MLKRGPSVVTMIPCNSKGAASATGPVVALPAAAGKNGELVTGPASAAEIAGENNPPPANHQRASCRVRMGKRKSDERGRSSDRGAHGWTGVGCGCGCDCGWAPG